jgi:tripartite ATP-independent transporter DctM subunit
VLILALVLFFALLIVGFDVGFSMLFGAVFGVFFKPDRATDAVIVPLTMHAGIDSAALIAVPMFILAGEFMNRGGVTRRLVDWSLAMVGHWRGSLSQVSVVTNFIMSGVSGSAVADASAVGAALIPSMKQEGYRPGYAGAVIAAGAMLGPIIPPSIPMIVYAVIANASVIRLFLAGIVPGLLLAGGYMVICAVTARRHGYPARARTGWGERLAVTRRSIWAIIMPLVILGGIRSGLFTDTEASAAIAVYALLIGLFVYRDMKLRDLPSVFYDAGRTAAVILFLLAAAGPFSWLISESRIAAGVADSILSITRDPFLALLIVNALLLLVGTVLEPLPALIILTPALLPVQQALGLDPTHFGLIVVMNLMIGMLHPPLGLLLFVVSAVGRIPIVSVAWEILPFLAWAIVVLLLVSFVPGLATFLPNLIVGP